MPLNTPNIIIGTQSGDTGNLYLGQNNALVGADTSGNILLTPGGSAVNATLAANLLFSANNTFSIGSSSFKPQNIYGSNSIITTLNLVGTGGTLFINASASSTTTHTINMPGTQGAASTVLTNDGSGNLSWTTPSSGGVTSLNTLTGALTIAAGTGITVTPSGGNTLTIAASGSAGANTALSNLASVAINSSLLPGVTNSINLGSAALTFANAFIGTSIASPLHKGVDVTSGSGTPTSTTMRGGNQTATGNGGALTVNAGNSSSATGGDLTLLSGSGTTDGSLFLGTGTLGGTFKITPTTSGTSAAGSLLATATGYNIGSTVSATSPSNIYAITSMIAGTSFLGVDGTTGSGLTLRSGNGSSGAGGALTVNAGSGSGSNAGGTLNIAGGTSGSGTAGSINLQTAGSTRWTVNASGNLVSANSQQLTVNGSAIVNGGSFANGIVISQPVLDTFAISSAVRTSSGTKSLFIGQTSGSNNSSGNENTMIGSSSGSALNGGAFNTSIGTGSSSSINTGSSNTAIGRNSLQSISSGSFNTGVGRNTISSASTTSANTAVGYLSLNNTTGTGNVAIGAYSGDYVTAVSNSFFVNNVDQTSSGNDIAFSLLYGQFSGTAGSLTGQKLTVNGAFGINSPQTTTAGSTSGTIISSQPHQGQTYKKVLVYLNALVSPSGSSYTYTTAFTNTPVAIYTQSGATVSAVSTTAVTITTSSSTTGYVILEGY